MVGKILIKGQIGNSYNADGSIKTQGVTVADIATQIAEQPNCEKYEVLINSPGGSVSQGEEIGVLIGKLPNCHTIASGVCASIATVPFLAVPKANRSIMHGTVFMIHNPLLDGVSGNASELEQMAEYLKPLEAELLNTYFKATGMPKQALKSMMSVETVLTPEQCVSMGFAGQIITNKDYKAVAFTDVQTNNKVMTQEQWAAYRASAKALGFDMDAPANERKAVALLMESDKGQIQTEFETVMVGDAVTMVEGGGAAPNDNYTLPDGTVIVVVDGKVSEIIQAAPADAAAQLIASQKEVETLKAQLAEKDTMLGQAATAMAAIEAKAVRSTYVPPVGAVAHRPTTGTPAPGIVSRDDMKARRAEYKPKKN